LPMPDFSYVVYRPLVTRLLSAPRARDVTLGAMHLQGLTGVGRAVFKAMAHSSHRAEQAVEVFGLRFPSRVGIGPHIDPSGCALRLWSFLGAGFVIVGPCNRARELRNSPPTPRLIYDLCSVLTRDDEGGPSPAEIIPRLRDLLARRVP